MTTTLQPRERLASLNLEGGEREISVELVAEREIEWVEDAQRPVDEKALRRMGEFSMDTYLAAMPTVYRIKGQNKFHAPDGRRRLTLGYRANYPLLPVVVLSGSHTRQRAARDFLDINSRRTNVSALEKHRISVTADDKVSIALDKLLSAYGISIASAQSGSARYEDNTMTCVRLLRSLYLKSPERLDATMKLIKDTWYGKRLSLSHAVVGAVFLLRGFPQFRDDVFMGAMEGVSVDEIAKETGGLHSHGARDKALEALKERYNAYAYRNQFQRLRAKYRRRRRTEDDE